MIDDPYKVLGVRPDASDDEIKSAYRRLARQYHPDLNPGDEAAAKKMQQINAAYEQIKNPEKARQKSGGAGYGGGNPFGGYDPFGGYRQNQQSSAGGDPYQQAAFNYIRFRRYAEAINALNNSTAKDARWYYLSALANHGLGNQVTALEHIRRAVSMAPDNPEYLRLLNFIEHGGDGYRQQAGNFGGFTRGFECSPLLLCCLARFCCFGRC